MKIVVLDAYPLLKNDLNYDFLKKYGEVEVYDKTLEKDVVERLNGADVCITNKVLITKEVIDQTDLKYISVSATGFNNVDLAYAKEKGILVTNVSNYSTDFVAQHTISLILHACNQVALHNDTIEKWLNHEFFTYSLTPLMELKDKTVGIVGYGNIAQKVIEILRAFGANIIVYNRTSYDDGTEFVSLEELLKRSDIISLHAPLNENNAGLFNKETLKLVKPNLILVNTARGGFVVEEDILEALNNDQLGYYLTDVLPKEAPDSLNFIKASKKIVVTPHIAWASFEARSRLLSILEENLKGFINNQPINKL